MTSYLAIIDTAVKIGLGALISGAAAYFLARGNQGADRQKMLLERKLGNLEKAAGEFNDYANAFSQVLSAMDGVRLAQKNDDKVDLSLSSNQSKYEFIRNEDLVFCKKRENLSHIYSRLRLLGAEDAANIISGLPEIERRFRTPVLFDKILPSKADIRLAMSEITRVRTEFYDAMQNHYKV